MYYVFIINSSVESPLNFLGLVNGEAMSMCEQLSVVQNVKSFVQWMVLQDEIPNYLFIYSFIYLEVITPTSNVVLQVFKSIIRAPIFQTLLQIRYLEIPNWYSWIYIKCVKLKDQKCVLWLLLGWWFIFLILWVGQEGMFFFTFSILKTFLLLS